MININSLRNAAQHSHEQVLSDLRMLVELETPSSDVPVLNTAITTIGAWLNERVRGLSIRTVDHGHHGPTLVAERKGTLPGRVMLVGHYDTVWPLGTIDEIPFTIREGIIRGPGVLDMKAGIVTVVHALRLLDEARATLPAVTIVLNGDEELGSPASRAVLFDEARRADAAFILEPGVGWDLKTERKGTGIIRITATGVEAHAGNEPERGTSAIHALVRILPTLVDAARPDAGTTINVGLIHGGTARNTVAGMASCEIDIRVTDRAEMDRIDAVLEALPRTHDGADIVVSGGWTRPPLERTAPNESLFNVAQGIAMILRGPLGSRSVGGGSDGNLLSDAGLPVIDGLGASGGGPHARTEHVLESDISDRITLVAGLLANYTSLPHPGP